MIRIGRPLFPSLCLVRLHACAHLRAMAARFSAFETARPAEDRLYVHSLTWCDWGEDRLCPRCLPAQAACRTHPLPPPCDDPLEAELRTEEEIFFYIRLKRCTKGGYIDFYDEWDVWARCAHLHVWEPLLKNAIVVKAPVPPLECHTRESFRLVRQRWIEEQQRQFNNAQLSVHRPCRAVALALSGRV